jgi:hypothetical protein
MGNTKGRNFRNVIEGKPVLNAKRRITLHISPADVTKGAKKNPLGCAAALTAMREIPNCTKAKVHLGRVYLFNEEKKSWLRFKTSDALRTEIVAFDRGGSFTPGEYDLIPLSPSELEPKRPNATCTNDTSTYTNPSSVKTARKFHVTQGVRKRMGGNQRGKLT